MHDICKNHKIKISNTYFRKEREKLITYKSGVILYFVICRPRLGQQVVDCKAIPGEECLTQHRLARADFIIKDFKKKKWRAKGG